MTIQTLLSQVQEARARASAHDHLRVIENVGKQGDRNRIWWLAAVLLAHQIDDERRPVILPHVDVLELANRRLSPLFGEDDPYHFVKIDEIDREPGRRLTVRVEWTDGPSLGEVREALGGLYAHDDASPAYLYPNGAVSFDREADDAIWIVPSLPITTRHFFSATIIEIARARLIRQHGLAGLMPFDDLPGVHWRVSANEKRLTVPVGMSRYVEFLRTCEALNLGRRDGYLPDRQELIRKKAEQKIKGLASPARDGRAPGTASL